MVWQDLQATAGLAFSAGVNEMDNSDSAANLTLKVDSGFSTGFNWLADEQVDLMHFGRGLRVELHSPNISVSINL